MKIWISLAGFVVVLFASAILWVTYQDPSAGKLKLPTPVASADLPLVPEGQPQPKVKVLGDERFDFGRVEPNTKGKHVFQFKNVGEGTLVLKAGQTTCKCTFAGLDKTEVPPGETTDITVEWLPETENPKFAQNASILTNDRDRPTVQLVIHGQVVKLLNVAPTSLFLPSIPSATEAAADLLVFSPVNDQFQITKWTFSDEASAKFFDAKLTPADASTLATVDAKSGYKVQLMVKPGLPLGRFQQTIRFTSDIPTVPELSVPVFGTITGHLSLYGDSKSWNEETGILTLGTVNPAVGAHFDMLLRIRGPHQDVQVESIKVNPSKDVLTVKVLGEAEKARNGKSTSIPLRIEIPVGAPPVNCLGSGAGSIGQILIKTNHPETPELKLLVSFAVRGE